MKLNIIVSYCLLFFLTLGFLLWWDQSVSQNNSALAFPMVQPSNSPTPPPPTPTPTPRPGVPQTFLIPKLGINTTVDSVGIDAEGKMDVPTSWNTVGWYSLGARPGENGSAVIDGHYDTSSGGQAVFYNLSKLVIGDTIAILDEFGKQYTYIITNVASYPFDQVPLEYVFTASDKPRLNLITCDGSWDHINRNYSRRVVIYSELKSSI